jgi:ribosomal protein S11
VAVTGVTVPTNGIYLSAANTLTFATNTTEVGSVNGTGNWTLGAPTSGTTLTVNGLVNQASIVATDGTQAFEVATQAGTVYIGATSNSQLILLTNGANRLVISAAGAVTVSAPTSGNALTLNGAPNAWTSVVLGSSTSGQSYGLIIEAGTSAGDSPIRVNNQAATASYFQIFGDGHGFLGYNATTANQTINWSAAGNVTLSAPTSGVALTVTGVPGNNIFEATDGTYTFTVQTSGSTVYAGSLSNSTLQLITNNTNRLSITSAGATTIPAPSSGNVALTVTGVTGSFAQVLQNTTSGSGTENYLSATNGTDTNCVLLISQVGAATKGATFGPNTATALKFQTNGTVAMTIGSDQGITVGSPTGGDQGAGTLNAVNLYVQGVAVSTLTGSTGTFTLGTTACSGATATARYNISGNVVQLFIPAFSGTSTATTFTLTGLPAAIQPARTQMVSVGASVFEDNSGASTAESILITAASGTVNIYKNGNLATWTGSGQKGLNFGLVATYTLY